jgi:superfamily I DNA and/or RNA helicase
MESALSLAMALPVQEESFRDGGADRAADIFKRLNKSLQPAEKTLLQKAVIWEDGKDLSFLKDLRRLRLNLLKKFTPKPEFKVEKGREEVISLVTEALADMERRNIKSGSRTDAIIAEFLNELENNPYGVLNSVSEYNYVFAATAQQAAGKDVRRAKTEFGKSQKDTIVSFDTVIIDEAARTSPRDLLIPMVQARNRIILVGDHKQLPHILNETVVKGMNIEDDEDFIKKSMFRYLIERARKLEEIDRIPRTVTLDAQYRMHPLLGDFVSRQFYEKDGEGFRSPLSEDLFAHNLPDTNNKPAVWLEVPAEDGQEGKAGTSRIRKAEARKIAQKLSKWMDSESGKGLSYGVISFYKAQCNQISEALAEYGITERAGEGEWAIKDEYQFLKEKEGKQPEERLRIGTVDAFQGMEFDVVFLSMVRSKREHHTDPQKPEGNEKTRIFGHLISLNRLCVSLSRQKKLLVIVGDSKMLQTNTAKAAVPALCDFYELCKTKGMIL